MKEKYGNWFYERSIVKMPDRYSSLANVAVGDKILVLSKNNPIYLPIANIEDKLDYFSIYRLPTGIITGKLIRPIRYSSLFDTKQIVEHDDATIVNDDLVIVSIFHLFSDKFLYTQSEKTWNSTGIYEFYKKKVVSDYLSIDTILSLSIEQRKLAVANIIKLSTTHGAYSVHTKYNGFLFGNVWRNIDYNLDYTFFNKLAILFVSVGVFARATILTASNVNTYDNQLPYFFDNKFFLEFDTESAFEIFPQLSINVKKPAVIQNVAKTLFEKYDYGRIVKLDANDVNSRIWISGSFVNF